MYLLDLLFFFIIPGLIGDDSVEMGLSSIVSSSRRSAVLSHMSLLFTVEVEDVCLAYLPWGFANLSHVSKGSAVETEFAIIVHCS